jgi:signal transduction histidine kinase/CheY-like chemotaxis protein
MVKNTFLEIPMVAAPSETFRANLDLLQGESLRVIAWFGGVIGYIWLWLNIWPVTGNALPISSWMGAIALLTGVILGFRLVTSRTHLASYCLVLAWLLAATCAVLTFTSPAIVYVFMLPIIFASVLLSQRGVFLIALLTLLCMWLIHTTGQLATLNELLAPLGVMGCLTVSSWLSARNLRVTLDWFSNAYTSASSNERIAREHEGQLRHALKAVDDLAYRLERLNYTLTQERNQAEEARRLKQEFAQTISHELRTPLNIIVAFTDLMAQSPEYYGASLPPAYLRDLSIVHRNASHLQALVNDVLDLARLEAAQMVIVPQETDPAALVQEAAQTIRSLVEMRGLQFKIHIAPNLPTLWIDATRIRQVLFNLLNNATRFTEQGSITLQVERQTEAIVFSVIDTGIGIAVEDIPSLFIEFHQLNGGTRRQHNGAGLGLAISKRFVELHSGRIWVESEPGKGSVFSFSLPLVPQQTPTAEKQLPWGGLQITLPEQDQQLVFAVTQSPSAAALLTRHLRGCRTIVMQSVREACQAAARLLPQCVILDSAHENFSLAQLNEIARAMGPGTASLIACPLPGETLMAHLDVNGYMVKPVSAPGLYDVLRALDREIDKILVVDDNHDFVLMLTRLLNNPLHRHTIIGAFNGSEALALIEHHQPDLIFLDMQLPDISSPDLIKKIRALPAHPHTPIVAISGEANIDLEALKPQPLVLIRQNGIAPHETIRLVQAALSSA